MVTAAFLSSDPKLIGSAESWVRGQFADKMKFETHPSIASFLAKLEKGDAPAASPSAATKADGGAESEGLKLVIIDAEMATNGKPVQMVLDLQKSIREKGVKATPKILMMAFEGGSIRIESLQQDSVDDLILKPIDKTLFLQKIEFLISDDPKLTPSFLFRAKTAQIIEVGRDVVIDEISEFAVAVRSPGAVPEGAFASIHSDVFGVKGQRRMIGRVYESKKHPVREGEFLVRFTYFGVTQEQLSNIRKFMRANQMQVRGKNIGGSSASSGGIAMPGAPVGGAQAAQSAQAGKAGLSKEFMDRMALLKMRKFAIIDMNPDFLAEANSLFETSFKGTVVRNYPSYARLAADLMRLVPEQPKPAAAAPAAKPAVPGTPPAKEARVIPEQPFPKGNKVSVILRGKTHELVRFETQLVKGDYVLGKTVAEWMEKPDQLMTVVIPEDKESSDEFLYFVESGTPGRASVRVHDATGRLHYVEFTGSLDKSGSSDGSALLKIEMTEIKEEQWAKAHAAVYGPGGAPPKDPNFFRFEAVLIDSSMLRPDPATWYERFTNLLKSAKVFGPEDVLPKIYVLSDSKSRSRLDDYRIKGIHDFSYKPLDKRFMVQKLQAFTPQLVTMREPENPPWVPCEIQAKLGREVVMDDVAEFGLSILHPSAFREKSFMRFFSPLFGEEGEWISGRCHVCTKAEEGENQHCQFFFFGPHEDLLQRIRRWIREDHVARKEKS